MKPAILLAAVAAIAVLGASCHAVDRETQVTVALSTETKIPAELDAFTVRVLNVRTGELRFAQDYFPSSGRDFPTTLAVVPADQDSLDTPIRVELEGRSKGALTLRRIAVVGYIEGRNLLLAMPLRMACFQFRDCGVGATCVGGQCVPAEQGGETLVDYEPGFVFPVAGSCFDEERCLATPTEVEVAEADCSFPVPPGDANVAIRWSAAPERLLALDAEDAREGWTRIDGTRGRLSQGACDAHFRRLGPDGAPLVSDWARQVYVTTAPGCPPKTLHVPACFSPSTGQSGIGALVPER